MLQSNYATPFAEQPPRLTNPDLSSRVAHGCDADNIAVRTERIRLGTGVVCLPFHNPLRVAEDIAAVDIVSKGRFEFGVGAGSQFEEFETFGIDPKGPFRSQVGSDRYHRTLLACEEELFSHEGKCFKFPNVRWNIPPCQKRVSFLWGGFGEQGELRSVAIICWLRISPASTQRQCASVD